MLGKTSRKGLYEAYLGICPKGVLLHLDAFVGNALEITGNILAFLLSKIEMAGANQYNIVTVALWALSLAL